MNAINSNAGSMTGRVKVGRKTYQIRMQPSAYRRMQLAAEDGSVGQYLERMHPEKPGEKRSAGHSAQVAPVVPAVAPKPVYRPPAPVAPVKPVVKIQDTEEYQEKHKIDVAERIRAMKLGETLDIPKWQVTEYYEAIGLCKYDIQSGWTDVVLPDIGATKVFRVKTVDEPLPEL